MRLFTRNGHNWSSRYPRIVAALRNRNSSFAELADLRDGLNQERGAKRLAGGAVDTVETCAMIAKKNALDLCFGSHGCRHRGTTVVWRRPGMSTGVFMRSPFVMPLRKPLSNEQAF